MKMDVNITAEDVKKYHLILWGDFQSNKLMPWLLLHRGNTAVPGNPLFQWNRESLVLNGQTYAATSHVPILITLNPRSPKRYIVVNSGPTHREGHDRTNSLQNPKLPDWAVIDLRTAPNDQTPGAVVDAGFFNERWKFK